MEYLLARADIIGVMAQRAQVRNQSDVGGYF